MFQVHKHHFSQREIIEVTRNKTKDITIKEINAVIILSPPFH